MESNLLQFLFAKSACSTLFPCVSAFAVIYRSPAFVLKIMLQVKYSPQLFSNSFIFHMVVFLEIISNVEFFSVKCVLQLTIDIRIIFINFYDVGGVLVYNV